MTKSLKVTLLTAGLSAPGLVFAGGAVVPEMDAGIAAVGLGLTVALVMLVKDRMKK